MSRLRMMSRLAPVECNVTAEQLLWNCGGEGGEEMLGNTRGLGYWGAITRTERAEGSRVRNDIENDSHSHSQLDTTHKRNTTISNCNYMVCNNINDLRYEHGQ